MLDISLFLPANSTGETDVTSESNIFQICICTFSNVCQLLIITLPWFTFELHYLLEFAFSVSNRKPNLLVPSGDLSQIYLVQGQDLEIECIAEGL